MKGWAHSVCPALDWGSGELARRGNQKTKQRAVAELGSALDWGLSAVELSSVQIN